MYLYHNTIDSYGAKLLWFTAEGRSIYEVATMFQRGQIKKEFIRDVNGNLEVAFYDHYNQPSLIPGDRYHLFLDCTHKCSRLTLCFKKSSFICDIYYMQLDEIRTSTWKQLLPSKYLQKKLLAVSSTNLDPSNTQLRPKYSVTNIDLCTSVESVMDDNIIPPTILHDDELTDYVSDEYIPSVELIDDVVTDDTNLEDDEFPPIDQYDDSNTDTDDEENMNKTIKTTTINQK